MQDIILYLYISPSPSRDSSTVNMLHPWETTEGQEEFGPETRPNGLEAYDMSMIWYLKTHFEIDGQKSGWKF